MAPQLPRDLYLLRVPFAALIQFPFAQTTSPQPKAHITLSNLPNLPWRVPLAPWRGRDVSICPKAKANPR